MIVVTGGSGFLGSWIVRALFQENIPLVVLVRPSSDCWRLNGLKNLNIIRSEPERWPQTISQLNLSTVVAADWEGVDGVNRGDRDMQFRNVSRTYALAAAARQAGVKVFIALGSQAEIGPHSHIISEIEKDNPVSAYGEAKVQLRQKLSSLFTDSDARFVWARVFSIYGPLDIGSGMLPTLIRTLQANKVFNATKGDQTWSYLYASDFASAVLRAIKGPEFKYIVNIGNPEGVQIGQVIRLVAQYMKRSELINFGAVEIDPTQSQHLLPLTSQLSNNGWEPKIGIDVGIRNTIDWFGGAQISMDSQELPLKREL